MFKIQYGSTTVNLPDPVFGDKIDYLLRINIKIAMSGKIKTHKRTPWIPDRTYSFVGVSDSVVASLKTLIRNSKDQTMTFTSYDGEVFTGKIFNEPTYELSNFDCRQFDFTLEIA